MAVPACLNTVVGLSDTTCPCIIPDAPAGFTTSLSGYYLDDPEYGFPLKLPQNISDCSTNDLWTRLAKARTSGINQFITDFGANLLSGPFKSKIQPFNGFVGDDKYSLLLSPDEYFALKLDPIIFRGAVANISSVTLYSQGVVNGEIIDGYILTETEVLAEGLPAPSFSLTMWSNVGTIPVSQIHNFQTLNNTEEPLYLVIHNTSGLQPLNNTIRCNCGKSEPWDKYFNAYGVTAPTLSGLATATETNYAYGFRIGLGVACGNSWLCQPFDFMNDAWARVMAECIALYGIKKLAGMILMNPNPEKYTMITRDEIALHRTRIDNLLGLRMPWLAQNIPSNATDCFTCNERVHVAEIMV